MYNMKKRMQATQQNYLICCFGFLDVIVGKHPSTDALAIKKACRDYQFVMCAIELPHLFVYRTTSMGSVLLIHTVEIRKLKKLGIPVCREETLRIGSSPCGNSKEIQKIHAHLRQVSISHIDQELHCH